MDRVSFISLISCLGPNKYFGKWEPLELENRVEMKEVDGSGLDFPGVPHLHKSLLFQKQLCSLLKADVTVKVVAEVDISSRTMIPLMRKGFVLPQTQVSNEEPLGHDCIRAKMCLEHRSAEGKQYQGGLNVSADYLWRFQRCVGLFYLSLTHPQSFKPFCHAREREKMKHSGWYLSSSILWLHPPPGRV